MIFSVVVFCIFPGHGAFLRLFRFSEFCFQLLILPCPRTVFTMYVSSRKYFGPEDTVIMAFFNTVILCRKSFF